MSFSTIFALGACQAGVALAQQYNGTLTPGQTVTRTVTRTRVGIVTACPAQVVNYPIGSRTTSTFVETTAVCPIPAYNDRRIVCYGNYCAPEYHCPSCERYRVVCRGDVCHLELATTPGYHRLIVCNGDQCQYHQCQGAECNRKLVCYNGRCAYETCNGNACQRNLVCRNERCKFQQCNGAECFQKLICQGKQCTPQPRCGGVGAACPIPPPFGTPIRPIEGPNDADSKVVLNANCPNGNGPNGNGPNGNSPDAVVCPGGQAGSNGAFPGAQPASGLEGAQPGPGEVVQVAGLH